MSAITAWIRALAGAAVFCAIALALCPEGRPKRVLRAACGVVMAAALLSLEGLLAARALRRWPESFPLPLNWREALDRGRHMG